MVLVHCNKCFAIYNKDLIFFIRSCGHVLCSSCSQGRCSICNKDSVKTQINKSMPSHFQSLFQDQGPVKRSVERALTFQQFQTDHLMKHLRRENERLNRLVTCFKKRNAFLMKKVDQSAKREIYTKIKQEVDSFDTTSIGGDFLSQRASSQSDSAIDESNIKKEKFTLADIDWDYDIEHSQMAANKPQNNGMGSMVNNGQANGQSNNNVRSISSQQFNPNIQLSKTTALPNFASKNQRAPTPFGVNYRPTNQQIPAQYPSYNMPTNQWHSTDQYGPGRMTTLAPQYRSNLNQFNNQNKMSSSYGFGNSPMGNIGNINGNYSAQVLSSRPISREMFGQSIQNR